jgi:hypothetical protein
MNVLGHFGIVCAWIVIIYLHYEVRRLEKRIAQSENK